MTVIVPRKLCGVTQLFNTETGRVTSVKQNLLTCWLKPFGGIIKFNHKVVIATVTGHITSLESCDVIKKGHPNYRGLYLQSFQHTKNLLKMFLIHIKKRFRNLKTSYRVF